MEQEWIEVSGAVLVLRGQIEAATRMRPTAVMLPLSLFPGVEEFYGLPVYRGDRVALIYEPSEV